MSIYRIKQFYLALTSKVDAYDIEFLKKNLNNKELQLFYKLAPFEQKHCINVARDVKGLCEKEKIGDAILVRAALLHDIGKIECRLGPIDKSLLVILHKLSNGKIKRFQNMKKIDIFYNHSDKGYNMLKNKGYDERFLYFIKNHHNINIIGDRELDLLMSCDNKN